MNKKFFFYFSIAMAVAYVSFGVFIMFFDGFAQMIASKEMRYIFGGLLILYGFLRSWRSYTFVKRKSEEK